MKKADNALNAALKLLSYRRYTSFELVKKLTDRGFNENQIKSTIKRLSELGYVEDEAILYDYSVYLAKEGLLGKFKIKEKLQRRGFNRAEINQALKKIKTEVSFEESVSLWVKKKLKERKISELSRKEKEKLVRFLINKGFELATIVNILKIDKEGVYES